MLKKIIAASVLGATAFSMVATHAATANDEALNTSVTATNGLYVMGQAGYTDNHLGDHLTHLSPGPLSPRLTDTGLAGRLAIGYQFNPYFAAELGYLRLVNQKGKDYGSVTGQIATITLAQNAIDLAAKGILPVNDKFNVYGKLGMAYLTTTITSNFNGAKIYENDALGIAQHEWAPEAAIGASYNVTQNMFVDVSLTHIQPFGKNRPGNLDFAAVGIGYRFG